MIAADNALFSIAEVRWGLHAAIIIPQLADAIGVRQVRRYALTGERFGAEEARRIGLVHVVVPLADLENAGARIVDQLLANGPEAIARDQGLDPASAWSDLDEADFAALVESHAAKRQSAEAAEGLASFAEKRAARWRQGLTCVRRRSVLGLMPRKSTETPMPHIEVRDVSLTYDTPAGRVAGVAGRASTSSNPSSCASSGRPAAASPRCST